MYAAMTHDPLTGDGVRDGVMAISSGTGGEIHGKKIML